MNDETITDEVVAEGATAEPETTTEAAENAPTETQPDQSDAQETTELSDDDYLAWAQKKNIDVHDDPKIARMLREADQKVSKAGLQAKTTLQKVVDRTNQPDEDADVVTELQGKYRQLETRFAATQYYLDNPDDKALDATASAILTETAKTDMELARGLGRNLPALFALARQKHSEDSVAQAQDEARKEERAALASKGRASATSSAATNSSPSAKTEESARLERFSNWK